MIPNEDIVFINKCFDNYYRIQENVPSGLYHPTGFPREMISGEITEDGWAKWKMLPSNCNEEDVVVIEKQFHIKFPPLFRAYLIARFQLFSEVYNKKVNIEMPRIPSENPFEILLAWLNGWSELINVNFIPFAVYEGGLGPVCFDSQRRYSNGDCPVVFFDDEAIFPFTTKQKRITRNNISSFAHHLYSSFQEMMIDIFLQDN